MSFLAHILIILVIDSPVGQIPVGMKIPMQDMAACIAYMADLSAPIVVVGAGVMRMRCVDEPSNPGKPA